MCSDMVLHNAFKLFAVRRLSWMDLCVCGMDAVLEGKWNPELRQCQWGCASENISVWRRVNFAVRVCRSSVSLVAYICVYTLRTSHQAWPLMNALLFMTGSWGTGTDPATMGSRDQTVQFSKIKRGSIALSLNLYKQMNCKKTNKLN